MVSLISLPRASLNNLKSWALPLASCTSMILQLFCSMFTCVFIVERFFFPEYHSFCFFRPLSVTSITKYSMAVVPAVNNLLPSSINMTRLDGCSSKDERLYASSPLGHWCATTMISSVRSDRSTACMTIEGAANTAVFQSYAREILNPILCPGGIVIMDNLRAHKNGKTIALIEQIGARVRFPCLLARVQIRSS